MLPTFVIGLREGLEAALIVGIIAAFLRKQGRRDLVGWMLVGVASAILLCAAAGVALDIFSKDLPQRQQEGLETVIGLLAVGMVTYMVVWMRRNSRHLKGHLEGMAADALASGHAGRSKALRAMIAMAFLAVIREGLETVVFLLAAFNESGSGSSAGVGAVLGILVATVLGYGIYRGGVRLNLSKFFRATGLVLVLVAAGLFVNALHTAHEAGWLNAGQGSTVDLSWLVEPGTVQASLLTGMLGIQSHPVVIEVLGWLAYLVPVGCYVAWPPGRPVPARALARAGAGVGVVAAIAAGMLAIFAPSAPAQRPLTVGEAVQARVVSTGGDAAVVRTQDQQPVTKSVGAARDYRLAPLGSARHRGLVTDVYRGNVAGAAPASRSTTLAAGEVARLNGGRLPIGAGAAGAFTATYRSDRTLTVWVDPRTDRVVDLAWREQVTATAGLATGAYRLPVPVARAVIEVPASTAESAVDAARAAHATLDRRSLLLGSAAWCGGLAVVALLAAGGFALASRRRPAAEIPDGNPVEELVRG